jgi:acetolactate decarboxylase
MGMSVLALLFFASSHGENRSAAIYQIGTLDDLLNGRYDGTHRIGELRSKGDFGLGTFNALDGEMMVIDGRVYQANAFGDLLQPKPATKTPFACVVHFRADRSLRIDHRMNSDQLKQRIDRLVGDDSRMIAVRIDGRFLKVVARAYPPQQRPYLGLGRLDGRESRFTFPSIESTFIGFRLPPSVGQRNVAGYHYHFVSYDRLHGGHVLSFGIDHGIVSVMLLNGIAASGTPIAPLRHNRRHVSRASIP